MISVPLFRIRGAYTGDDLGCPTKQILHRLGFCGHREKAVNASGENLYGGLVRAEIGKKAGVR